MHSPCYNMSVFPASNLILSWGCFQTPLWARQDSCNASLLLQSDVAAHCQLVRPFSGFVIAQCCGKEEEEDKGSATASACRWQGTQEARSRCYALPSSSPSPADQARARVVLLALTVVTHSSLSVASDVCKATRQHGFQ